jgi:hypothetical protein
MVRRFLVVAVVALGVAGCGGDDDGDEPAAPVASTTTQAEPLATSAPEVTDERPERPDEPRRERTPASLADCLRDASGVSEVLVKGRDSEDATFFSDLAGGRVDVLGVTLEGEATEVTVALFDSPAAATKAAPDAGGGGVEADAVGSAVVLAAPGAKTDPVERCLRETRYAAG